MSGNASSTSLSFPHLNVSTAYSAHYGTSWPDDLVAVAASHGADMLACTDRDGLYGMVKHLKACISAGIAPIVGVNLAIAWDDHAPAPGVAPEHPAGRAVILALGQAAGLPAGAGYSALVRLITTAHAHTLGGTTGGAPYVTMGELAAAIRPVPEAPNHLLVLAGPDTDAGQQMGRRHYATGRARLARWASALPTGSLCVEVVNHLAPPGARLSTGHAIKMLRAATELSLPAVLTNAVRYATVDEAATADVLDAARTLSSLTQLHDTLSLQPNGQGWLKSGAAMHQIAQEISRESRLGAESTRRLLATTHQIAERCVQDPVTDIGWGRPRVPEASVIGLTRDPMTELIHRTRTGLEDRYATRGDSAPPPHVWDRLDHELAIIRSLDFPSYFLTVAEVVRMIETLGVRVSARGSGASSLVNYALRISHVDPIEHDLIFERFLSRDRSTLPDIDIDVESARRHEIYRHIFDRFGTDRTTLMSMQNGYRVRGALRDAGRALEMTPEALSDISRHLWRFSASHFRDALDQMPELAEFSHRVAAQRAAGNQQLDLLVDLTERLDRLPRHISMHPCGIILGDAHLLDRTPVQPSGMGLAMSQFDKHDMDPLGMLKLDVLGVRMQSTIAYSLDLIQKTSSTPDAPAPRLDLETIPHDDPATFQMIQTTHTLGCFQIESPGQRELIGKLEPETLNDLIIDISLFRPGPMKSDMVRPFLDFRHGDAPAHYAHPALKPILEETHGVTVFHEQLLRTLDLLTGCGLARADELRRKLGSDDQPEVEAFVRRAAHDRGWPLDVIDDVWDTLAAFGSFGFCKAHGAAFAIPTYESAWLKTHYPEAFMAAVLEHDPGMYPQRLMVAEARRMGIPILPVDINRSTNHMDLEWVPDTGGETGRYGIRLAFTTISGLSEAERRRLVAHQPYTSLADVRDKARLTRRNLEHLAELGALDSLIPTDPETGAASLSRTDLVHYLQLNHLPDTSRNRRPRRPQYEGQLSFPIEDTELTALPAIFPDPTPADQVRTELDLTAIDTTGHLMESYYPYLNALGVTPAHQLLSLRSHSRVLIAGVRVATQTPPMRSGRRVVFISLDDSTGVIDTAFFTEAQHHSGNVLFSSPIMLIEGTTRRTGQRAISVQAIRAWDLRDSERLPDPDYLDRTRDHWATWLRGQALPPLTTTGERPTPVPHHSSLEALTLRSLPGPGVKS